MNNWTNDHLLDSAIAAMKNIASLEQPSGTMSLAVQPSDVVRHKAAPLGQVEVTFTALMDVDDFERFLGVKAEPLTVWDIVPPLGEWPEASLAWAVDAIGTAYFYKVSATISGSEWVSTTASGIVLPKLSRIIPEVEVGLIDWKTCYIARKQMEKRQTPPTPNQRPH